MAKQSMSEEFYQGVGNMVDDMRAKFEEAVWGRAVTERGESPAWPQAPEPEPSFGSATHTIDAGPTLEQWPQADQSHAQRIEREQNRDADIDR